MFDLIEQEYQRTIHRVLDVTGETALCERFPRFRRHLARRLPVINQVGRQQVALIKRFREARKAKEQSQDALVPLLLSINCIAAGLGSTG